MLLARPMLLLIAITLGSLAHGAPITLETSRFRYEISETGRNLALVDRVTNTNLLVEGGDTPVCTLQRGGVTWESSAITVRDDHWEIAFGDSGVTAVLRPTLHDAYLTLEVVSVSGDLDQLNFLYLPLDPARHHDAPACTTLALSLQTQVHELPGPMNTPMATAHARFGIVGARVALIVAPAADLRHILQQVMERENVPRSPLGGPWALDAEINRGSYLIDTEGELGEESVGDWIELAHNLGMRQIDLHTGKSMRFGDLVPNPERYPNGPAGVRNTVDRLHEAGLAAGLHTYAFFVAKDSRWVSPVPDRRLATSARFTLAEDITTDSTTFTVAESTVEISTVTGFQIRNSVTLRIDDELIVFSGVNQEAPFGFTQCERGAWGTKRAAHAKGAEVVQLKECFGLFVPDGDSTLFTEVAARTAEVYNESGFDMIYLDALDGADILAGGLNGWYYAAKFVQELNARLERPALFEMSTMTHHIWAIRSRMGAWDVPARGTRRLTDIHVLTNREATRAMMSANLGWSGIFDWNAIQPERTYPEDVEHLCAQALAGDFSLSLLVGFTPASWERSANVRRLGAIIQRYETVRMNRLLPETILEQVRTDDGDFRLHREPDGAWTVAPRRLVELHPEKSVQVENPWGPQAPSLRIEALAHLAGADAPKGMQLLDGEDITGLSPLPAAPGVSLSVAQGPTAPESEVSGITLTSRNENAPAHGAWGGFGHRFDPPADLNQRGLGLWVHGDGSGAVLNVQLQSTLAAAGGRAEHYIDLDFTGWKYVELVEPESARLGELTWPYSRRHADWGDTVPFGEVLHDYILWVHYGQIEWLNLWINQVEPGTTATVTLGPISALPVESREVSAVTLDVDGEAHRLPVTLRSGDYVEIASDGTGTVFDAVGALVEHVALPPLPQLPTGAGVITLHTDGGRAKATLLLEGPPVAPRTK